MTHQSSKVLDQQFPAIPYSVLAGIFVLQGFLLLFLSFLSWLRAPEGTFTLKLYYDYSLNFIQGQVPYRDFVFEYPPLALMPMILPHLAKLGQPVNSSEYALLFMSENIILTIFAGILFLRLIRALHPEKNLIYPAIIYTTLVIILAPVMLGRYDTFPVLLTLLSTSALACRKNFLAGIWVAFGIAAKLYPVVLIPIFSLFILIKRGSFSLLRFMLGVLGGTFVSMLLIWNGIGDISSFLSYHQNRGLQVESIPAGLIILGKSLGFYNASVEIVSDYGAKHIVSPLADAILNWQTLTQVTALIGLTIFSFLIFKRSKSLSEAVNIERLVTLSLLALLTFIIFGKVFSPQYIVWLLAFVPFLNLGESICFAIISLMTIAIYPFLYDQLLDFKLGTVVLLNLRNALLIFLFGRIVLKYGNILRSKTPTKSQNA